MEKFVGGLEEYNEKLEKLGVQKQVEMEMKESMKLGNKEKRDFLRVVMGEFAREGKELTDKQALEVIKKMYKNATELQNDYEKLVLEYWVPTMLTDEELRDEVEALIVGNNLYSMEKFGQTMGLLQKHPKRSMMDMKIASQFAKEILLQEE